MTNIRNIIPAFCACAVLLGGCSSVPSEHFYTLLGSSGVPNRSTDSAMRNAPGIVIASVTLPEAVDRAELVIRSGENRVEVLESRRWAESLKSAIPRVVADNLSELLGGAMVSVQSDNAGHDAKYVVLIDVTRFDSTLNDAATMDALWSVRPAAGGSSKSGKSSFHVPVHGPGFDELVAAHALALANLSKEIAVTIKAIEAATD